jgi:hypothetical protein
MPGSARQQGVWYTCRKVDALLLWKRKQMKFEQTNTKGRGGVSVWGIPAVKLSRFSMLYNTCGLGKPNGRGMSHTGTHNKNNKNGRHQEYTQTISISKS